MNEEILAPTTPPAVSAARAPASAPDRLDGILSALARRAGDRRSGLSRDVLAAFGRAFHFGTPGAHFTGRDDAALADELLSTFELAQGRQPNEVRVRVVAATPTRSVLQVTLRDQPYLLDSVRETLRAEGIAVHRYLHPILRVERAADGSLKSVRPRPEPGTAESFLHFEVEPLDPARGARLEAAVRRSLADAVRVVDHSAAMRASVESVASGLVTAASSAGAGNGGLRVELEEAAAFLSWLLKGNFTLLGVRSYTFAPRGGELSVVADPGSALGILHDVATSAYRDPVPLSKLEPSLQARMLQRIVPLVSKTNRESLVLRRSRMDYIGIKKLRPDGAVVGEHRILGFFTPQALNQLSAEIPVLRRKLEWILARAQVLPGSHDHMHLVTVFNSLPKAELLATGCEEIARSVDAAMEMESRDGIRVDLRRDSLDRGASVMVILPRDRFSSEVRLRIQDSFARVFGCPAVDYRLALGEEGYARLHFYFQLTPGATLPASAVLEREVQFAVRTWDDALREELLARLGEEQGGDLASRFAGIFSPSYRATFEPSQAVDDLPVFEELSRAGGVRLRLCEGPTRGSEGTTLLRFYRAGSKFYLSELMPILSNLGLRVLDELTFRVSRPGVQRVYLHTIRAQASSRAAGGFSEIAPERWSAVVEAVLALLEGKYENDGLSALVVTAGLSARQVELLRTFVHYLRQLRAPHTNASMVQALCDTPRIAAALVAHFETKFRPSREAVADPLAEGRDREKPLQRSRAAVLELLDAVDDLSRDRILRALLETIDATVRTNYFQAGETLPRIGVKVRSAKVGFMPKPVPLYEIYVHNAEMEGVHLRSGRVARGGIRWSDRRDDFRTEILGLMRTQQVKNAVIVPVGSKGGFVLKRPGDAQSDLAQQVTRQYRTLISGLLDITDNLVGGTVVHPKDAVLYDEPDPYLVVAADKGTATFSDLANRIAAEYDFWLGDAFASGGSKGYNHKKEGITARGAWECAQHLLRELSVDPSGPLSVAGIGDMSGDVFGNGLVLSTQFRLVAAFDHRHIVLDPSPDLARAFAERKRLFELPRSSWADYDGALISKGGGVWRRDQKRIPLSPEARGLLATQATELTGEELVREILRMPVDLLWNGGIGTYFKASSESHGDVGDSRNDSCRVDATEIRARVIGEGGNLGLTQAARVECALRGVRLTTDFIDNSAGVDLSDHEVNIKIALESALAAKRVAGAERDGLLEQNTDAVCGLVLRHNRQHAQLLSVEEALAREDLLEHAALAQDLTEAGLLDPRFERFPDDGEMRRRAERRAGLLRPELAILLGFSKIEVARALRESTLLESEGFEEFLVSYFPPALLSKLGGVERLHPLRREISVSQLLNEMFHRVGMGFVSRFRREVGATSEEVVAAWRAGDLLLGGAEIIETLRDGWAEGRIPGAAALELLRSLRRASAAMTGELLRGWPRSSGGGRVSVKGVLDQHTAAARETARWIAARPAAVVDEILEGEARLAALGAPDALAAAVESLEQRSAHFPAARAAVEIGASVVDAVEAYAATRVVLTISMVERSAEQIPAADVADRAAARVLLAKLRSQAVAIALKSVEGRGSTSPTAAAQSLLASRPAQRAAYQRALPAAGRPFTLGLLMALLERLHRLAAG